MRRSEPVYAIPSWINGRAILQAARHFQDIRNPVTRAVVRRAPLCGRENLAEAMRCARASLSSWAVTELLKGEMGFEGVAVTDAMNMGAIAENYSSAEAAVQAI